MDVLDADPAAKGLQDEVKALRTGRLKAVEQRLVGLRQLGRRVKLARAKRLGEGLAEGTTDRHRLPDALHVGGEAALGARELLEGKARHLGHYVVDRRLEGGGGGAGDVVGDLLEGVANRELRRHLGNWKAGRLGGQGRGARDARIHLDHDYLTTLGVDAELDVGATGLHSDRADHRDCLVAQLLVERVGERLGRRHRDRVARVDPHRVDVLDRADDDDVVVAVAHHLQLELAPAQHRLLDQHLVDRACREALRNDLAQLGLGLPHTAALAPHREGRTDDRRQGNVALGERRLDLAETLDSDRPGDAQAGIGHRAAELLAILGAADRGGISADQLDPEALQRAVLVKGHCQVECRLAAERRQQRVGPLLLDDPGQRAREERLDVGSGGELRVGHDRRRVGVDEDDLVTLLQQHLAGLHAGVVKLGRLADHDRTRADQEDLLDVGAFRHGRGSGSGRIGGGRRGGRDPPRGGTEHVAPATSRSVSPSTVRS